MTADKLDTSSYPGPPIFSNMRDRSCAGMEPASNRSTKWAQQFKDVVQLTLKNDSLTVTGRAQRSMHMVHFKLSSNIAGCA